MICYLLEQFTAENTNGKTIFTIKSTTSASRSILRMASDCELDSRSFTVKNGEWQSVTAERHLKIESRFVNCDVRLPPLHRPLKLTSYSSK